MNPELQIALDKIKKENNLTQTEKDSYIRAIEEANAELQNKNRELEIESSLERVRSAAMAMKDPADMVEICQIISDQLELLNVKEIRNVQTAIFYESKGTYFNFEYYSFHKKSLVTEVEFINHPMSVKFAKQMLGGTGKFFTRNLKEQDLKDWYEFQKTTNQFVDTHLEVASSLNYYWYSLGPVALGISTYSPLNEDEINLFKRFRNVFELAYRRYLDIEKAEAQAREAQIQLALERVRAKTMGMHNSSDLLDVINILSEQFQNLGFKIDVANFNTSYREKDWHLWLRTKGTTYPEQIGVPYFDHPYFNVFKKNLEDGLDFSSAVFTKEEKNSFQRYLYDNVLKDVPEERKESIYDTKGFAWSVVFCKNTALTIANFDAEPYTEEQNAILRRFGNVFEQTYTRFLDLQKAEAQARDAQIEAALERVRSRTMAMHKSEDLSPVTAELFKELSKFGGKIGTCGFVLCDRNKSEDEYWVCWETGIQPPMLIPHTIDPTCINLYKGWEEGKEFYAEEKSGDELKAHFDYMLSVPSTRPVFENWLRMEGSFPIWQRWHAAYFKYGFVFVITDQPYPEEQIFKRFASVFGQAYTRFLDLQKAEAQAREAQIEAALEKVRSRSLAMHHSDELEQVAASLFDRLAELGLSFDGAGIYLFDKEKRNIQLWGATIHLSAPFKIDLPYDEEITSNRINEDLWNAIEKGEHIFNRSYSGKIKNDYFSYVAKYNETKIPESVRNLHIESESWTTYLVAEKNSLIGFDSWSGPIAADEYFPILLRFARVFEQAYTRFLDLQKAEAQSRESQIQLALERVRARTMAMQHSDELPDAANILFQQTQTLGMPAWSAGYCIWDDDHQAITFWMSSAGIIQKPFRAIVRDDPSYIHFYEAWKRGETFYMENLGGDEIVSHYQYLLQLPGNEMLHKFIEDGGSLPTFQIYHLAFFSQGFLLFITYKPVPESHDIFKRFAKVFEQTYTRFLDLQKSEEQARESQIQLALERLRARTMAMQHSNELAETVSVLFKQLLGLGIKQTQIRTCAIVTFFSEEPIGECWITKPDGEILPNSFVVPYNEIPTYKAIYDAWKQGEKFLVLHLLGDALVQHQNYLKKFTKIPIQEFKGATGQPNETYTHALFYSQGYLLVISGEPLTAYHDIFKRVGDTFQQTYTRFLDLQKAEAQAREAQIEASLERVRSKTMAMHNSNDVRETVATMFAEFVHLDIYTNRCGILIYGDENIAEVWTARSTPEGNAKLIIGKLDMDAHKLLRSGYNAWKAKQSFYQYDLLGDDLKNYYTAINNSKFYPTQFDLNALPTKEFHSDFFFSDGALFSFTNEPVAEEQTKIIKRFASVFGQTYRRYLDLQKAEAQAREAKIEAALEKVRSRSLAMHHSDELEQVAASLFGRLVELGLSFDGALIFLFDKEKRSIQLWIATTHLSAPVRIDLPYDEKMKDNAIIKDLWNAIENGKHIFNKFYLGQIKNDYFRYVSKCNESKIPESVRNLQIERDKWTVYFVAEKNSLIGFDSWSGPIAGDEYFPILTRFSKVFEQAYTRFLDLKKAEVQAREAQIQLALERVRARTMAMQKSDELREVVAVIYEQLQQSGFVQEGSCNINIMDEGTGDVDWWMTGFGNQKYPHKFHVHYFNHPMHIAQLAAWKNGEKYSTIEAAGDSKKEFDKLMLSQPDFENLSDETKMMIASLDKVIFSMAFMKYGALSWAANPITDEQANILQRFAKVFEQTYTRFLDLQNAEAQAREATVEAALERVRSKAMSMYNSNDLSATVGVVFAELEKLGIKPIRSGVGLISKEDRRMQLYSVASRADSNNLSLMGEFTLSGHPVFDKQYECWLRKENYFTSLKGKELSSYYKTLSAKLNTELNIGSRSDEEQFAYWFMFSEGFFYTWSEKKYSEAEINMLDRFKNVIELTFRRYIDLKKSEANAKEAVKQAALDRIRADIASMRTVADLDRITPLIWSELTVLDIPFVRSGVFIMDDAQKQIHTFLSTPDGKAIGAFHLPYDTPGAFADVVSHWRQKKIYLDHWSKEEFINLADTLVRQGAVSTREQYLTALPDGGIHLHFLPFLQGMLYVGNTKALREEEIELLLSVADAFSTAYARYEDFNRLEAAKQQVEKTLVELKQAQQQLVQSEKMASLGELTAGIAHEIQNPLNFVNNFSEVSNELIGELDAERLKPNAERDEKLVRELLDDIKQNLEKINHHGKRADAIVKGMLQHSRTSAGQKEATDINALADEYLRLAYHGLRAKDKTFNTKFETDFDSSIGKINIVPQDIGRVILNLINNAFYAVSEKQKAKSQMPNAESEKFEPCVSVQTKKVNDKIEIIVKDNGDGIPRNVVDKIFQPFFTTKPAGQGTGLGLSLTYDIIKAHGGEIKVETQEGEGSEFIIQLPSN